LGFQPTIATDLSNSFEIKLNTCRNNRNFISIYLKQVVGCIIGWTPKYFGYLGFIVGWTPEFFYTDGIPIIDNIPEKTEKLRCPTDNISGNLL